MSSASKIFKEKLLKGYLDAFHLENMESIDEKWKIMKKWQNVYKKGVLHRTKETAVQGLFLSQVFGDVLGYKTFVDGVNEWNQYQEVKSVLDTSEADGGLGFFTSEESDVRVVIELKDANTPLDKKQNRSNHMTPVEQAFSYANKQGKRCQWVIVSNFVETRLYHSNSSLEYETFSIINIDEKEQFKRFLYLLNRVNLINKDGKSTIDELYLLNEQQGKDISNNFYREYKDIRNELWISLKDNNPTADELMLFSKSQKLMDRFIFICFCEDCGLLPEKVYYNLINNAKYSFDDSDNKMWKQLKGLFRSIDMGNAHLGINRYNGGLFKSDAELDSLVVSDGILERLLDLSEYDFKSDLNVNILGQIFEQSIGDLEEIKREISGSVEEGKGKQKEDGIFYTPYYVTRYIVEQTVGRFLKEEAEKIKSRMFENGVRTYNVKKESTKRYNKVEFNHFVLAPAEKEDETEEEYINRVAAEALNGDYWIEYENVLKNLKILDPACGSGAFLNACFDYLKEQMEYVLDMKMLFSGGQHSLFDIDAQILQNNLFGVDINAESVEITKLALWLKTAKKNSMLTSLDDNIKCGNSLISNAEIAEDLAFRWEEEFAHVFERGGFDIVIGNPPYGAMLSEAEKKYISKTFSTSEGKYDTYHTFFELGMKLLKDGGYLGYITPNTYLILENGTTKLRKYLFDNYTILNIVELFNVFSNAIVEPLITVIYKGKLLEEKVSVISVPRKTTLSSTFINDGKETLFSQSELKEREGYIFNFRETDTDRQLKRKIKIGSQRVDSLFNVTQGAIPYGKGEGKPPQTKETIKEKPYTKFYKEDESWVPYYKGVNINRYMDIWAGEYIKWGEWLCRPRTLDVWEGPKLFVRQTGDYPIATYIDGFKVGKNSIHSITPLPDNKNIDLKYLLALLNSKLMRWVFRNDNFHIVGKPLAETKAIYIKRLPIKVKRQNDIVNIVDVLLLQNENKISVINRFIKYINAMYSPKEMSKKMQEFYLYDYKTFLNELKKCKIKLMPKEQMELLDVFEEFTEKINQLDKEILKRENEIDELVYEIYEISPEEVAYILENI